MEFTVHYWCAQWPELTGFEQGDIINEQQVMQLITEGKVNVMVHHGDDGAKTCFIDDIDHHFQQR